MRRIDFLVAHTAGSYDFTRKRVVHQKVEVVRAYHMAPKPKGNGWNDLGYHRYIEVDGKIRLGRRDAVVGAHAEGFNAHTLAACCSGHGDFEPFNDLQLGSLVAQFTAWCRLYTLTAERCLGHKETEKHGGPHVPKTCPGTLVDMAMIRDRVREVLAGVVRAAVPVAVAKRDDEAPPTQRDGSPPSRPKV